MDEKPRENQYKTLKALVEAIKAGKVKGVLAIDNDTTYLYAAPDYEVQVFEMHPTDLLEQALKLLGVKFEGV